MRVSDPESRSRSRFQPALGLFDATAISVGAIIGAGIFVVTGIVAGLAGSALIISMIISAGISIATALSFVELTTWQPKEGSIYEYAYQLISPLVGFLVGWMWILSNIFTAAAVSLGFAHYLMALFPALPVKYVAAVLSIVFAALNFFGIRSSARLNNLIVMAKLIILAFFVIFGLFYLKPANFKPFLPFNAGVIYGAFYIFFAYGGFARVAIVADEIKEPRRNVPKAILLSLLISTVVYIFVGVAAVGLVGAANLSSSSSPLTRAIEVTGNKLAITIVSAGALLATASVLLTAILGVSRMAYAMARRNALPSVLSQLHPKYRTPYFSIWTTGAVIAILVLLIDLSKVVAISSFSLLFYYSLANVSALRLRIEERLYPKFVPLFGAFSCLGLLTFIFFISTQAWVIGLAGLATGIVFYAAKKKINHNRI
jgi:APA family basic amino acid/polyamine antiporter